MKVIWPERWMRNIKTAASQLKIANLPHVSGTSVCKYYIVFTILLVSLSHSEMHVQNICLTLIMIMKPDMDTTCVHHTVCSSVYKWENRVKAVTFYQTETDQHPTWLWVDASSRKSEGTKEERVFLWTADLKVFQRWMRMKLRDLKIRQGTTCFVWPHIKRQPLD